MVFVKKSTFFHMFLLSKKGQKETFYYILDRKECHLDLKSEVLTKSKNRPFSYMFFLSNKSQKEAFFDILVRK